jgi:hypothetical protein
MVRNMCFFLRSYKFKSRRGRVCISSYSLRIKKKYMGLVVKKNTKIIRDYIVEN